mgnify:FL=1|jgi:hypothetical protein
MKKNYFLAIAVAALMLATTLAQAADITFSGQFRPRFEVQEDANNITSSRESFATRVRLNAAANINANTSAFLQFQSVGTWGNAGSSSGSRASAGGSDAVDDVGFHQAFLTFKNFLGSSFDAKVGRQEVVLDGHRLFGHTGWTTGAQTNDAIRFNHSAGNHTVNYIYIAAIENGSLSASNDANSNLHVFRAATQGVMGGDLTGYFVIADDRSTDNGSFDDNTWYTVGARQKGKMAGLDYRVEFYHQFGDGAVDATAANFSAAYDNVTNSTAANGSDIDRNATMFGIRVGKTFKNATFSPTITLWFDSLSGTDDDDATNSDMGTFNTVQDTGHKFYGLIDNYTNAAGTGTNYYGLQDIAIKAKFKLSDVNTLKVDWHQFLTHTDLEGGDSTTIRSQNAGAFTDANNGTGVLGNDLGQEIDVTLVHKYDSNTKIVAGYSHYFTTVTHGYLNGSGGTAGRTAMDGQDWMYVMMDTKF